MTRFRFTRSALVTAGLLLLAAVAWLLLAPTRLGGSTDYVSTHGDSMAPRFHTGDLAVVRRARRYRVGDVVAYRSRLLHTVVLHRIVAVKRGHYVFKGDNNDFLDPVHPDRASLVGRLWLRVPRGGVVLGWLHAAPIAAVMSGGAALLLLLGGGQRRRRRGRRASGAHDAVSTPASPPVRAVDARRVAVACAATAAAFLLVGLLAFTRPLSRAVPVKAPYTERVTLAYHATVPGAGPVYPGGIVTTGDPVFLRLVHRVRLQVAYRLSAPAPHRLAGTIAVIARLTSPTGWSRNIPLGGPTRFAGDRAGIGATLDLARVRSLVGRVERLTGAPPGGDYSLTVMPRVHLAGTLARQRINSDFSPASNFQLSALQLKPAAAAVPTEGDGNGFAPSRRGSVTTSGTAPRRLAVRGHGITVAAARWISLFGLLLGSAGFALAMIWIRRHPRDVLAEIEARYRHLIVQIAGEPVRPAGTVFDVTNMKALARLAERGERLILHHRHLDADTFLVDDEGTLYRYRLARADGRRLGAPGQAQVAAVPV